MHADRKTAGRSEGKVTVNGFPKEPASFARVMGYCEQFDIHSPGLTVGESVYLSASLRLSSDVTPADVRPCRHCSRNFFVALYTAESEYREAGFQHSWYH